jgi:uncharacterized protein (DUF885 family)
MTDVRALADRLHDLTLRMDPLWASVLGDHRFAGAVPAVDAAAEADDVAALRAIATATAAADLAALSEDDRITVEVVREEASTRADLLATRLRELEVAAAMVGPQVQLYEQGPVVAPPDLDVADALVGRYRAVPGWFAAATARLDAGAGAGRTPPRFAVDAAVRQLDGLLARSVDDDPLLGIPAPPEADPRAVSGWRERLHAAVAEAVRPALAAYREHLATRVAPTARPDERAGLCALPEGEATYAAAIRRHTTLPLTAEELHEVGREEIARLAEEYAELGERVLGTADVTEVFARLREDPALRFATAEEVRGAAESALARAQAAVPSWFGLLPRTGCVVRAMAPHEVEDGTIAYYMPPAPDGSRPGGYHVNTHRPDTRTRFEAEALAFHEAVPGHHLQIALAQERADLPPLRRHVLPTAYVEGWALYTERLADEMGLYSDDLARLGMLSFDSWRACRLVVDTGLHALGWTRQQAVDHMLAHSPQAANNIANEVDRYLVWPGQALAYKVGQRRIAALRTRAERRLGGRFDVAGFHDAVLRHGAVPLRVLDGIVDRWVAQAGA